MIADEENGERRFTNIDYIDSIEDPFFKTVAQQVIGNSSDSGQKDDDVLVKDRLEVLEIALRKKLLELLLSLQGGNETADGKSAADVIGAFWKSSLDLCHHFVHHACSSSPPNPKTYKNLMPSRRLPYLLLSDCLEGLSTLEDAKAFWSEYVEPELVDTVLFGDQFWCQLTEGNNSKKFSLPSSHLPFLKVANQFLKRLEHSSENMVRVEWKGRIMWALSKGFSITDKSSMKLWGNFHTTNETDFETKEEFDKQITPGVSPSTNSIEYNLYEAFWSLQSDLSNPNKINVAEFIKRLRLILAAMESATASSNSTLIANGNQGIDKPTTKYLTSSALLPSQIQDPAFRSSVVTQFLIVASHLGAESPPLKNALAGLLGRARKLLKNDNPQLHDILWDSILASGREDHWRTWKKQRCAVSAFAPTNKRNQQLVLDSFAVKDDDRGQKRKRAATEEEKDSSKESIVSSLSANDLSKNELVAVSKDSHHKIPTLDEHLEFYVEALDPESGIEDEYHPKNDSLFTWRAMRLYAKHQLPLISQCRKPAHLEKITRIWYKESHGTDIPGEMPADEPVNNEDNKSNDDTDPIDDLAGDDQEDTNEKGESGMDIDVKDEKESTSIDTDMKDSEMQDAEMKDDEAQEEAQKQAKQENNDEDRASSEEAVEETVESGVKDAKKADGDEQKALKSEANQKESESTKSGNAKNEKSPPATESRKGTESSSDGRATKPKTDNVKEETPKDKKNEASKSNTATSKEKDKQDKNSERGQNNRNDNKKQEKRPPRDTPPPQNRGGGRRGNDEGRKMQDRGRRDDGPQSRRRGDDNHQSRGGGRSGGDSSYRGRSDAPPSRGGRYDDDYRGDSSRSQSDYRGDRFSGDRSNRSTGRDNHRGGERAGGIGRDDHRGGGGRPRAGGGGGRRRR